ncbi:helix-turn-helix domain-containing protein [Blastococcus sp. CT_GayMR16]|uniref:ArsR/SmtB family transcription factor n=1 Tax=Blastococcus sp. CT_GayMR16 TaxID=2559607 RepID=UPI001073DE6F|nr:helix-turn-helix domain-containing protein [Blastococcus sp. CT_GayMR16]TFV87926.1 ArsR family transcriptional regulator [Blastococcus sp. CT_GayMR16]
MVRNSRWGVQLTDPAVLKALAHPARLQMLDVLQDSEGATATQCAAVVGLSASACSWHLRLLHRAGLVEHADPGADGRERRWRSSVPSWQVSRDAIEADVVEARALDMAVTRSLLEASDAAVETFTTASAQGDETLQWRRAALVSNSTLWLTAEELLDVTEKVGELLEPYRRSSRTSAPEDARITHAALRFVPQRARLDGTRAHRTPDDQRA